MCLSLPALGQEPIGRWRSAADGNDRLIVEKLYRDSEDGRGPVELLPLSDQVRTLLGPLHEEYEGIAVALVSAAELDRVVAEVQAAGHRVGVDDGRSIAALDFDFDPRDPETRLGPWSEHPELATPLPQLAWVQFLYLLGDREQRALEACGLTTLGNGAHRARLIRAPSLEAILGCEGLAGRVALVEPALATDRVAPDVRAYDGEVEITMATGSTLDDLREIVPGVEVRDLGSLGLPRAAINGWSAVQAGMRDPRVLRIARLAGPGQPSDERQAQILARRFVDATAPSGQPIEPAPGGIPGTYTNTYLDWLDLRDLYDVNNPGLQYTIAFVDNGVDKGIDDGSSTNGFHPDFRWRIDGAYDITCPPDPPLPEPQCIQSTPPVAGFSVGAADWSGHGNHVIGTAIGAGTAAGRSGTTLEGWFAQGQGIAPQANALLIKRFRHSNAPTCSVDPAEVIATEKESNQRFEAGHTWALTNGARIVNNSWNLAQTYTYTPMSDRFERMALQTSTGLPAGQALIVFSAGNEGSFIQAPANAKNVLTVGSVDSWYPGVAGCLTTPDAVDGPYSSSAFSAIGSSFNHFPSPSQAQNKLHLKFVHPTVVAPGWRVDGPRRDDHPCNGALCGQTQIAGPPRYNYARGTSFAAPAVSGAAALRGKQLVEGGQPVYPDSLAAGFTPSPTLLKAALVATAQSPGPRNAATGLIDCTFGNCRPSHLTGWGLVDLDRLTDPGTPVFVHDHSHAFTAAGQTYIAPAWLEAADPSKEVLIALVWHDVPPDPGGAIGQALRRDLDLKMWAGGFGSSYYHGNSMEENVIFQDTGYSHLITQARELRRDGKNNVEVILLPPNTLNQDQFFRLSVTSFLHSLPNLEPLNAQSFSIYAWNVKCYDDGIVYYCEEAPVE